MTGRRSCPWELLTSELVEHIASLLPPNEVACTFCLISKSNSKLLRAWKRVRLSQLVPHHAFIKRWGSEDSTRDLTLEQRKQLLCLTASSGSSANLEVALTAVGCLLTQHVFTAAAFGGHIEVCVWLLDRDCPREEIDAIQAAAEAGHVAVVRWMLQRAPEPDDRSWFAFNALIAAAGTGNRALCEELLAAPRVEHVDPAVCAAAKYGHVDLTLWFLVARPHYLVVNSSLLSSAAYGFPLPALQRLYDMRLGSERAQRRRAFNQDYGGRMAAAAFISPTPDWRAKVEWLEAVGCGLCHQDCNGFLWAADDPLSKRPDAVERVALLRERGALDVLRCLQDAIRSANLSVLRYLRSEGLLEGQLRDHRLMCLAAEGGNVIVMEELLTAGWSIQEDAAFSAASRGHLHVLQWMQGPEARPAAAEALHAVLQDPRLMMHAAESGSLELVVWLRERGCPWHEAAWVDERSFLFAVQSGNVALLEWMAAQGCPMATGSDLLRYLNNDDLATLRCLKRLGCISLVPPTRWLLLQPRGTYADSRGPLAVLRWLAAEGFPVDWEEAKVRALRRGDVEKVLAWIVDEQQQQQQQQVAAREDGQQ